jgi:glycosyltransferase involved in cell wall biosynthesis
MRVMLTDAGSRERLRRLGLQRATCFTWESCARNTLAVYRLALEDR